MDGVATSVPDFKFNYEPKPDRKVLMIRKLEVPKEIKYRMMQKEKERQHASTFINVMHTFFFGDGF